MKSSQPAPLLNSVVGRLTSSNVPKVTLYNYEHLCYHANILYSAARRRHADVWYLWPAVYPALHQPTPPRLSDWDHWCSTLAWLWY